MLAETIQLSGPETAALLAIFVGILLVILGAAVVSVIAAHRAGKGSRAGMFVWAGFAAIESVWLLSSLVGGSESWGVAAFVLAVQGVAYWQGTQSRAPDS